MRRVPTSLLLGAVLVLGLGAGAQAGVVSWDAEWIDASPLDMAQTGWMWENPQETWIVWERYISDTTDSSLAHVWGEADVDPIIHVQKTVTNDSTFVWTDFHVEITGSLGVSYVPGSATSDKFLTVVETLPGTIDFYAPQEVAIGDTVTIDFDIEIPAGLFDFNVWQMPTPEPTTAAMLLGLGALTCVRRKR